MFLGTEHSCGEGMKDLQMDTMVKDHTLSGSLFMCFLMYALMMLQAGLKMVARTAGCIHPRTRHLPWCGNPKVR